MSIYTGLEDTIRLLRTQVANLHDNDEQADLRIQGLLTELHTTQVVNSRLDKRNDELNGHYISQRTELNKMYDANDELQDIITSLELKLEIIHLNSKVSS